MTGKRKRDTVAVSRDIHAGLADEDHNGANNVFRQYFESIFEPLQESTGKVEDLSESSQGELSEDDGDWEGFSELDSDSSPAVQIVEHNTESASGANSRSNTEFKAFMVSQSLARSLVQVCLIRTDESVR